MKKRYGYKLGPFNCSRRGFSHCYKHLANPKAFYDACLSDMCSCDKNMMCYCDAFASLRLACERYNISYWAIPGKSCGKSFYAILARVILIYRIDIQLLFHLLSNAKISQTLALSSFPLCSFFYKSLLKHLKYSCMVFPRTNQNYKATACSL